MTPDAPLRDAIGRGEITLHAKDGETYRFRPIRPEDAPSLMRGYDALSERAKRFRMLHAVPHLTEEMAAAYCAPDPVTEFCGVLEGRGALEGEIIGGARVSGLGPGARAEYSVSLRPEALGLGLARQSLQAALDVAWESGCAEVFGLVAARNAAMLRLAKRLGFSQRRELDDPTLVITEIARPAAIERVTRTGDAGSARKAS